MRAPKKSTSNNSLIYKRLNLALSGHRKATRLPVDSAGSHLPIRSTHKVAQMGLTTYAP